MRDTLQQAIHNTFTLEFYLPNSKEKLDKSCLSTIDDSCFRGSSSEDIARVIYNGLVEFAINEYNIDYERIDIEQRKALLRFIRYNPLATEEARLKYGFYGEVLLDLVLRSFMSTNVLLARGYLYSPIEKGEAKGFDAFHLTHDDKKVDLWLGEAKFYQDYKLAISQVLKKLHISLSDNYLHDNLLVVLNERNNISHSHPQFTSLLDKWENEPEINLIDEMEKHSLRITYPVFIIYEQKKRDTYVQSIKKCIEYISEVCTQEHIQIPAAFDYRICFMFLPIDKVKATKKKVLEWIESREPLI